MDAFIARQPIFDQQLRVYGYELLFRAGLDSVCCTLDQEQASDDQDHRLAAQSSLKVKP